MTDEREEAVDPPHREAGEDREDPLPEVGNTPLADPARPGAPPDDEPVDPAQLR